MTPLPAQLPLTATVPAEPTMWPYNTPPPAVMPPWAKYDVLGRQLGFPRAGEEPMQVVPTIERLLTVPRCTWIRSPVHLG